MPDRDACTQVIERFMAESERRDSSSGRAADRTMRLRITDLGHDYHARLVGRHIEDLSDTGPETTDITLDLDSTTLVELFSGTLSPFVALSSRRARLDAPLKDMPRLRALFFGAS